MDWGSRDGENKQYLFFGPVAPVVFPGDPQTPLMATEGLSLGTAYDPPSATPLGKDKNSHTFWNFLL
jgi:hypothetical protein